MNVLTTCKFNEDLMKNKQVIKWTTLFFVSKINKLLRGQHYSWSSRASNSELKILIWPKLELIQDFMDMLQSACLMKIG